MLTDTHCHLDFPEFDADRDEVIRRAREAGLSFIINIGSSVRGSGDSVALAEKHDFIYATVGVHPHHAGEITAGDHRLLEELLEKDKVVAIGEVGLDYYRDLSPREEQKKLFVRFIHLAREKGLPLIVHSRDAHREVLEILRAEAGHPVRGVIHCFSAGEDFARKFLDLGLYLSFTANITFKKADRLREVARVIPPDRLFLETDAPFLAPQVHRGQRNEPAYVRFLAEELAEIKGGDASAIADAAEKNARKFFKIKDAREKETAA